MSIPVIYQNWDGSWPLTRISNGQVQQYYPGTGWSVTTTIFDSEHNQIGDSSYLFGVQPGGWGNVAAATLPPIAAVAVGLELHQVVRRRF